MLKTDAYSRPSDLQTKSNQIRIIIIEHLLETALVVSEAALAEASHDYGKHECPQ